MAKELGKNVTYEIVLLPPESRGGGGSSGRGMAAEDDGGSMTEARKWPTFGENKTIHPI